jgi:hypothetical protein
MLKTNEFQREISLKLSNLLVKKINDLEIENNEAFVKIHREYWYQISVVQATMTNHNINLMH